MLESLIKSEKINEILLRLKIEQKIIKYTITYTYDAGLKVNIVGTKGIEKKDIYQELSFLEGTGVGLEFISHYEFENDSFYQRYFAGNSDEDHKLSTGIGPDLNYRKRLHGLLGNNDLTDVLKQEIPSVPIVTFYSFKGGVGRTTTLALFATYIAIHHKKRVVILDCDFESPGILNFFNFEESALNNTNGIVEYYSDTRVLNKFPPIENYVLNVPQAHTGEGEILVVPSGNLSVNYDHPDRKILGMSDLYQYLEGLARFEYQNIKQFTLSFHNLIENLEQKYNPDVFLLDCRPGFNDIFGTLGLNFSDIIVGFFGSNSQNIPGIHSFCDALIKKPHIKPFLVNSIITNRNQNREFEKNIDLVFSNLLSDQDKSGVFDKFSIYRDLRLESLGSSYEDKMDLIESIERKEFHDFTVLFDRLNEEVSLGRKVRESPPVSGNTTFEPGQDLNTGQIPFAIFDEGGITDEKSEINNSIDNTVAVTVKNDPDNAVDHEFSSPIASSQNDKEADNEINLTENSPENKIIISEIKEENSDNGIHKSEITEIPVSTTSQKLTTTLSSFDLKRSLKTQIVDSIYLNFPTSFGENPPFDEDLFFSRRFYFRSLMADILSNDKFIIKGSKGTGKTSFAKGFENETFINKLCELAGLRRKDFVFIDQVDTLSKIYAGKESFLDLLKNSDALKNFESTESYFSRFWKILLLYALEIQFEKNNVLIDLAAQTNDEQLANQERIIPDLKTNQEILYFFENTFKNDTFIAKVERKLKSIDTLLRMSDISCIIIYDQLNQILNTELLVNYLPALINCWRQLPYASIHGKIFIRTDFLDFYNQSQFYRNDLVKNSIDLEWSQDEIYSFFFKTVLAHSGDELEKLLHLYKDFSPEQINYIFDSIDGNFQPPTDFNILSPLVQTFFGKYVNPFDQRQGETYQWFRYNLQSAKGHYSIKLFMDLIKEAIHVAKSGDLPNKIYPDKEAKPILNIKFFKIPLVRAKALEGYLNDLFMENDYKPLKEIFHYIRNKIPKDSRMRTMYKDEFNNMLNEIIQNSSELSGKTSIEDLKNILLRVGVISESTKSNAQSGYMFAYLYKHYLDMIERPKIKSYF